MREFYQKIFGVYGNGEGILIMKLGWDVSIFDFFLDDSLNDFGDDINATLSWLDLLFMENVEKSPEIQFQLEAQISIDSWNNFF